MCGLCQAVLLPSCMEAAQHAGAALKMPDQAALPGVPASAAPIMSCIALLQALVTPRGECYIEAAIQSGRHGGGSSSEGAGSEG